MKLMKLSEATDAQACGILSSSSPEPNLGVSPFLCTADGRYQGTRDEIFPIDDYYLALQHGFPKEARYVDPLLLHLIGQLLNERDVSFVSGAKHMGEPLSFTIVFNWLYGLLDIKADPREQLQTLPFRPQF